MISPEAQAPAVLPPRTAFQLSAGTLNLDLGVFVTQHEHRRLTARELSVVDYLLKRRGELVSRESIAKAVWPEGADFAPRSIDQLVKRLRKKLESDPSAPEHIFSAYGEGYRFVLDEAKQPHRESDIVSLFRRKQAVQLWTQVADTPERGFTIAGRGGMGKSVLAQWLHNHWPATDCVFVEGDSITNMEALTVHVAEQAGLDITSIQPGELFPRLTKHLQGCFNLIILDDAGHLDASLREWVSRLITQTKSLKVVVTSRSPLGYPGEYVETLSSLEPEAARDLFWIRANAAGTSQSRLEALGKDALNQMLERLDHMPLAIEIVASQSSSVALEDLVEEVLSPSVTQLAGPRDLPERQRTLWNSFLGSWRLLHDNEKVAWLTCAAVPLEADESLVGAVLGTQSEHTSRSLLALTHRHLLQKLSPDGKDTAYRIPGLLREFATSQLDSSRVPVQIRTRVRDYLLELAESYMTPSTESPPSNPAQKRRHSTWMLQKASHEDISPTSRALLTSVADTLRARSTPAYLRIPALDAALADTDLPARLQVLLMRAKGECLAKSGKLQESFSLLLATSNLAKRHELHREYAQTRSNLGLCKMTLGEPTVADELFSEARAYALAHAPSMAMLPTINLAVLYGEQGRFEAAQRFIDEARESHGYATNENRHLLALLQARISRDIGPSSEVDDQFEIAVRLFRERQDLRECVVYSEWALHDFQEGRYKAGLEKLNRSIADCTRLQLGAHMAAMLCHRALGLYLQGDHSGSLSDAEHSLRLSNELGSSDAEPLALAVVAIIHATHGTLGAAEEAFAAASSRVISSMSERIRPILRTIRPYIYTREDHSAPVDPNLRPDESPSAQLRIFRHALSKTQK